MAFCKPRWSFELHRTAGDQMSCHERELYMSDWIVFWQARRCKAGRCLNVIPLLIKTDKSHLCTHQVCLLTCPRQKALAQSQIGVLCNLTGLSTLEMQDQGLPLDYILQYFCRSQIIYNIMVTNYFEKPAEWKITTLKNEWCEFFVFRARKVLQHKISCMKTCKICTTDLVYIYKRITAPTYKLMNWYSMTRQKA